MTEKLIRILTSTVFAALVASAASVIVAIMNNRRLNKIEGLKHAIQISLFRYERLYERLINWRTRQVAADKSELSSVAETALKNFVDGYIEANANFDADVALIDEEIAKDAVAAKDKAEKAFNTYVADFSNRNEFMTLAIDFENKYKQAVQRQMAALQAE